MKRWFSILDVVYITTLVVIAALVLGLLASLFW